MNLKNVIANNSKEIKEIDLNPKKQKKASKH
jgi:hypothetical protein